MGTGCGAGRVWDSDPEGSSLAVTASAREMETEDGRVTPSLLPLLVCDWAWVTDPLRDGDLLLVLTCPPCCVCMYMCPQDRRQGKEKPERFVLPF